jgi:hypothetical protein
MSARVSIRGFRWAALALSLLTCATPRVRAQGVGFVPVVAPFPSGVTFPGTPVVSDDRRYVRLTVAPQFNTLEGFNTISVPAAVSGGGGNGLGGLSGLGLGLGGGNRVAAGMNGIIEPGMGAGPDMNGPGFATPGAGAILAGLGGPVAPPRLSDGLPPVASAGPRLKSKGPRVVHKKAGAARR